MRADLHVHTCFSYDSLTKPETFVKFALKARLGAIAITDHNTAEAWKPVQTTANLTGLMIIPGEEIMCWDGKEKIGELMGLFLQEHVQHGQLNDVLDQLKSQDAIIAVSHPFDFTRHGLGAELEKIRNKIHAVEVFNAHTLSDVPNQRARAWADKSSMAYTAGSDAHTPWEIGAAWVEAEAYNLEELREAILKRRAIVGGKRSSPAYRPLVWLRKIRLMPNI